MRGSGVAVGSAASSRSWAEPLGSILGWDRDTLGLSVRLDRAVAGPAQPGSTMRQLLEASRRVGELEGEFKVTASSASGLLVAAAREGVAEQRAT